MPISAIYHSKHNKWFSEKGLTNHLADAGIYIHDNESDIVVIIRKALKDGILKDEDVDYMLIVPVFEVRFTDFREAYKVRQYL